MKEESPRLSRLRPTAPLFIAAGLAASSGCGALENMVSASTDLPSEIARVLVTTVVTALVARSIVRKAPPDAGSTAMLFRSVSGGALGGATAGGLGLFLTALLEGGPSRVQTSIMVMIAGVFGGAVLGVFGGIALFPLFAYTRKLATRLADDAREAGLFVAACIVGVGGLVAGALASLSAKGTAFIGAAMLLLSVAMFGFVFVLDLRRARFLARVADGKEPKYRIVERDGNDPPLVEYVAGAPAEKVLAFAPDIEGGPFRAGSILERIALIDGGAKIARKRLHHRAVLSLFGAIFAFGAAPLIGIGFALAHAHSWRAATATPWRIGNLSTTGDTKPVKLSSANGNSCALLADTTIRCWGNSGGRVAGSKFEAARDAEPHATLRDVRTLSVGDSRACVVGRAGERRALCWGLNFSGELGDGTTAESKVPTAVGPPKVVAIAHGQTSTIVATEDGEVWVWGTDVNLEPHYGGPAVVKPAKVEGLYHIVDVRAGRDRACALDRDGRVWCWGSSLTNQNERQKPTRITELPDKVDRIVVGPDSIWAHSANGWWGWGSHAVWGPTSLLPDESSTAVERIPHAEDLESVHLGSGFACGIFKDGTVKCWGNGESGRLGDGDLGWGRRGPSVVKLPMRALEISGSERHTCVRGESEVWCWGWL